jgi:DNA polymerase
MASLLFLDVESRGSVDVTEHGVYEHVDDLDLRLLCVCYALGDAPVQVWRCAFADGANPDACDPVPPDLLNALQDPDVMLVAHNAGYERAILNALRGDYGLPFLPVERFICTAAWAAWHNLPRSLDGATKATLPPEKRKATDVGAKGKFMWSTKHPLLPEHVEAFETYQVGYCAQDVESMRAMFGCLTPPTSRFLQEYATVERMNDRGVMVDMDMVQAAVRLAPAIDAELKAEIAALTDGEVKARGPSLLNWLRARLPEELHSSLVVTAKKRDELRWFTEKRFSTNKAAKAALIGALETAEDDLLEAVDEAVGLSRLQRLLELHAEAGSASVRKYQALLKRVNPDEGCLRGSYIFAGAGQTKRLSSAGVQLQNIVRAKFKNALAVIDAIKTCDPAVVKAVAQTTVNVALSRSLRPAFMAEVARWLIWSDWSAIEARVLPWLTGDVLAQPLLDLFRRGEDVYIDAYAKAFGVRPEDVTPEQRQIGKVMILSLGFGGGVGAFEAMARGYGVVLPVTQIKLIVKAWRRSNPWATKFWKVVMDAIVMAIEAPGTVVKAGRVKYVFLPGVLGGSLACELPCGEILWYRRARIEDIERNDKVERAVIFDHPTYGVAILSPMVAVENITQAAAASLLRQAMVACDDAGLEAVLSTHDEIVIETDDPTRDMPRLHEIMLRVPDWAEGLPLAAETEAGRRYKMKEPLPLAA